MISYPPLAFLRTTVLAPLMYITLAIAWPHGVQDSKATTRMAAQAMDGNVIRQYPTVAYNWNQL